MRELFDRLRGEGEAGIERLIAERMQEGVQLDFKRKGTPGRGSFEGNDKKILAKAVSGFANSAGGLLVWGVNAEKGPDGVDCALAPAEPIAQIELFLSEATTLIGQLIQPRHDGIHLHAIPSAVTPGAGYLLIYVERSERRPHRSEASGQKQYFKRAGDSFFEMEHYDIEDAFSRVSSPKLSVRISSIGQIPTGMNEFIYTYQVELVNESDYIAKFPFISCRSAHGLGVGHRFHTATYKIISTLRGGSFVGGVDDVIHPGTHGIAGQLAVLFQRSPDPGTGLPGPWRMMEERSQRDGPSVDYLFGCEGMRGETGSWSMPRSQFNPPR